MTTATPVKPDKHSARITEIQHELDDWKTTLLAGLDGAKGPRAAGEAEAQKLIETKDRWFELGHELRDEDFDPAALACLRGHILGILELLAEGGDSAELLDRFLIRLEAMRQILRDALDEYPYGQDDTTAQVVDRLTGWLDDVSQNEIAKLLGVSTRTLQRWAGSECPATEPRLLLVARLVAILRHAWTPRGVVGWFNRPRVQLDDQRPVDLLGDGGYEFELLQAARTGSVQ